MDIEWIRIAISPPSGPSQLMPTLYTTTGSPERGYQSVLTTSEKNDTVNTIIYRCTATVSSYSSFSDTTVYLLKGTKTIYSKLILHSYITLLHYPPNHTIIAAIASSPATISVTNTATSITGIEG